MQISHQCLHCHEHFMILNPFSQNSWSCVSCHTSIETAQLEFGKGSIVGGQYLLKYLICHDLYSQTFISYDTIKENLCLVRIYSAALSNAVSDAADLIEVLASAALISGDNHLKIAAHGIDDEYLYQVHPYREIDSLQNIVLDTRTLKPLEVLRICQEILLSLDEAYIALGTGHLNLSPTNIYVNNDGTIHYSGFGMAPQLLADQKFLQSNFHVLNLHFTCPEMALAWSHPKQGSDIYSLGCIIFFCLTGVEPFAGITDPNNIDYESLNLPRRVEMDLDPQFIEIFTKMTAMNPLHRYQSYRDCLDAIQAYISFNSGTIKPKVRHHTARYQDDEFQHLDKRLSTNTQQLKLMKPKVIQEKLKTSIDIQLPEDFSNKFTMKSSANRSRSRSTATLKRQRRRIDHAGNTVRSKVIGDKSQRTQQAPQAKQKLSAVHLACFSVLIAICGFVVLYKILSTDNQQVLHNKPVEANDTPKITKNTTHEFAMQLTWLKKELSNKQFDPLAFNQHMQEARRLLTNDSDSHAILNELQDQANTLMDDQILYVKETVNNFIENQQYDQAMRFCQSTEENYLKLTQSLKQELIPQIKAASQITLVKEAETTERDLAHKIEMNPSYINEFCDLIFSGTLAESQKNIRSFAIQYPESKTDTDALLNLLELCQPESITQNILNTLAMNPKISLKIDRENGAILGKTISVNRDEESFVIIDPRRKKHLVELSELNLAQQLTLIEHKSVSATAFIKAFVLAKGGELAAANQIIKNYQGPFQNEVQMTINSKMDLKAQELHDEVFTDFNLDQNDNELRITSSNARVAHYLLSQLLDNYSNSSFIENRKTELQSLLNDLTSHFKRINATQLFVSPDGSYKQASLREALNNEKIEYIFLLPGDYNQTIRLTRSELNIFGCTGSQFTQSLTIANDLIYLKQIQFLTGDILIESSISRARIENCFLEDGGIHLNRANNDILINNCFFKGLTLRDCKRIELVNCTIVENAKEDSKIKTCIRGPFEGSITNCVVYAKSGYALISNKADKAKYDVRYSLLFGQSGALRYSDRNTATTQKEFNSSISRFYKSINQAAKFGDVAHPYNLQKFSPGHLSGYKNRSMGIQVDSTGNPLDIEP